jgi:ribosomal protein S18 acetylase RimI-like enzyme
MCPAALPSDLDARLAARGYARLAPTLVQTAPLAAVLGGAAASAVRVEVAPAADAAWLDLYFDTDARKPHEINAYRGIIERIPPPVGFARAWLDGEPVAVGLGVAAAGWLGVFGMATLPAFRRRGTARAVLRTLADWGREHGAERAYLQVMEDNAAARALYEGIGFRTLYGYHYREGARVDGGMD